MSYYAVTIFLSAFLLFQVEPMIGKYILPWFGGIPAVWSTIMVFFQVMLLAGYAYSHWLVERLAPRRQGILHLGLLAASISLMLVFSLQWRSPITPGVDWKPQGDSLPVLGIFKILLAGVGLPYLILSTNSPIMQAWHHYSYPGKSPYRLYALSNVGSLLALISYPILFEPLFTLRTQAWIWSLGYFAFVLLGSFGAIRLIRRPADRVSVQSAGQPAPVSAAQLDCAARPGRAAQWIWVAFAACASALLLAVTNQISQEVAAIPFLWILPLSLYLVSFIVCFSSERWYSRNIFLTALILSSGLYCWVLTQGASLHVAIQLGVYSLLLFTICMICHGEIYRLRPAPQHLTKFYLLVSIGGALGGIFVNFVAPYIFKGFWELPLGVLFCWVLFIISYFSSSSRYQLRRIVYLKTAVLSSLLLLLSLLLYFYYQTLSDQTLYASRNFYGVMRVKKIDVGETGQYAYQLVHGATAHGFQYIEPSRRGEPTAYFTEESGIGLAFLNLKNRNSPKRIGILGLGVGVMAAYGQPGDTIRYYEINPDMTRLAEGAGGFFSFLRDTPAKVEVVPGDARISLEQEAARGQLQQYDLLVLDTFNSDSIPVHLLTKEAFEIYLKHLQPDGVIALHITNRHLDIKPVVIKLADYFHISSALIQTTINDGRQYPSTWMLLSYDPDFLNQEAIASRSSPKPALRADLRLWTDDYSNIFQILK